MISHTKNFRNNLKTHLKKYQKILTIALKNDHNEANTVTIVKDIFADIGGYDKYSEITSEYEIKNKYCDIAVKLNDTLNFLIEVKAIGNSLKKSHMEQARNYAANEGCEWVVLTNGIDWRVYHLDFGKAIADELVLQFNMLEFSIDREDDVNKIFASSKSGIEKKSLHVAYQNSLLVNKHMISALLVTEPVLKHLKKWLGDLKKLNTGPKQKHSISHELIQRIIEREVIKEAIKDTSEFATAKKRWSSLHKKKQK
ncbi:MAG: type I restriction enzyme HsdR N-terminal domain-containing protein [Proteobacteria bacterium]|nr:type I restriction enzyme HsdR N-terminal domain-containing protein [Pseudomonadota bacterium]